MCHALEAEACRHLQTLMGSEAFPPVAWKTSLELGPQGSMHSHTVLMAVLCDWKKEEIKIQVNEVWTLCSTGWSLQGFKSHEPLSFPMYIQDDNVYFLLLILKTKMELYSRCPAGGSNSNTICKQLLLLKYLNNVPGKRWHMISFLLFGWKSIVIGWQKYSQALGDKRLQTWLMHVSLNILFKYINFSFTFFFLEL